VSASRAITLVEPVGEAAKPRATHTRLFANTVTVGVLLSIAKLAGAAKIVVIARFFGTSDALDAFLIALLLPSFVADLVAGSLTPCLVPMLVRAQAAEGIEGARRLASVALSASLGLTLIGSGGLALGGRWLIRLAGSSFPEAKLRLATALFFLLLWWLPMSACIAAWRAVLNANRRFALAAIAPIASPLSCVALLYAAAGRWGVAALCAGTVGGVAIECLALGIAVRRLGYPLAPRWKGAGAEIKQLSSEFFPLLASTAITSGFALIDQSVAGRLGSSQVSALVYGNRLSTVLLQVAAAPIGVTILPMLARLAASCEWKQLRRTILRCCAAATALAVPLTIVLAALSGVIVHILFERGAFRADAAHLVAYVQRLSLLQLPFAFLLAIATRLTSALSANILLARVGVAALLIDVALDLALSRWMGVAGIALSAVLVQLLSLALLSWALYRRAPELFVRHPREKAR
jgi:putative peptidoglycan lipid II flippase